MKNAELHVQIIDKAIEALTGKGWTKGVYARGEDGTAKPAESALASCFCLLGALKRGTHFSGIACYTDAKIPKPIVDAVATAVGVEDVGTWHPTDALQKIVAYNDAQETAEPVIAVLEQAKKLINADSIFV